MDMRYVYMKTRSEFGKQCFFEDAGPNVEENIFPDERHAKDYVRQKMVNRSTQKSTKYALHEVRTKVTKMKKAGVLHLEGSWPREISPFDEEIIMRYRRRIAKSDNWITTLGPLLQRMEGFILQNNAVNIHEYYFDDLIPSELTMIPSMKVLTTFSDQEAYLRPVNHVSWSMMDQLAVAYCFKDRTELPSLLSPNAYIWDFESPNVPLMVLKSTSTSMVVEFNPRDPSLLISGLMSGQVCSWDTRVGDTPVHISEPLNSHRNPASQAFWISSKTNTEFFSSSNTGTVKWWDIRNLRRPTDVLIMDIDDPDREDINSAIGVSVLQYEPTMGSRFLLGLENGTVINVNRKAITNREKLHARYHTHVTAVVSIDRNPAVMKNFVTIGDWYAKIWTEEFKETSLIKRTRKGLGKPMGACWSRSRMSLFYTIDTEGKLDAYDILQGSSTPFYGIQLCEAPLTAIKPHADGQLLAVGNENGDLYIVQSSGLLTTTFPDDKLHYAALMERNIHYEKIAEARQREVRKAVAQQLLNAKSEPTPKVRIKEKRKTARDKSKARDLAREKMKSRESAREGSKSRESAREGSKARESDRDKSKGRESDKSKDKDTSRKSRVKKSVFHSTPFAGDKSIVEAEKQYFYNVESERIAYETEDSMEIEALFKHFKKMDEQAEEEKAAAAAAKVEKTPRKRKEVSQRQKERPKRPKRSTVKKLELVDSLEKIGAILEADSVKSDEGFTSKADRRKRDLSETVSLRTCPMGVCKPQICCLDVVKAVQAQHERERAKELKKFKRRRFIESSDEHPKPIRPRVLEPRELQKWQAKITEANRGVIEKTAVQKKRILLGMTAPPSVLNQDVKEAKKGLEAWKETIFGGKRNLQRSLSLSPKRRMSEEASVRKGMKKRATSYQDVCSGSRSIFDDLSEISEKIQDDRTKVVDPATETDEPTDGEGEEEEEEEEEEESKVYPRISEAFFPALPKDPHI